ncbi:AAA family ATPase [Streptomyces asoensis]|uniref:AAA family ATPase n=1 Tax=Streptomyces asoensis TaxID=249586 RepID=A0A6M4WXQ0_9ACTN|nr:AAA family ATPase [Streptomyces asoensis]QJT04391.1 AAA family ATPase [Streptomyces asoensis]
MSNVRHLAPDQADHDGLNRTSPHDAEAEEYVVGIVMHSKQAYDECALLITRDDLYKPAHQLIWDTAAGLHATGQHCHPALVRAELEKQGQLHRVEGGALVYRLGTDTITPGMAAAFAERIAETARQRRYDAHSTLLKTAIDRKADGDELAALVADFQQAETLRENTGRGPSHLVASLLNWGTFFATDFGAIQLLPGKLMGPGQQITLVGDGKAGKSLFCQEWMWRMATGQPFLGDAPQDPVRILYLDAENGQEQVQERFLSFGAGPRNMGELRYASFPPIRPLDTAGGGADLLALVKATGAELVVIDTVSRFIGGPENDADTWLSLYRHTLLPLKRDRIASVRLDHFGKDKDRGGRGSSAKTQDVDHVWELTAQGGGTLALKRTHTRTGIGPEQFTLLRQAQRDGDNWAVGGTRHVVMTWETEPGEPHGMAAIPGTVEHIIAALDRAGLPNDAGNRAARDKLAELRVPGGNNKIADAIRRRKARSEMPGIDVSPERSPTPSQTAFPETFPGTHPGTHKTPGQTFPGTPPETPGTPPVPHVPPSKRGNGEGTPERPASEEPLCTICTRPMTTDWANRGYDTHLGCDPATGSHPDRPTHPDTDTETRHTA